MTKPVKREIIFRYRKELDKHGIKSLETAKLPEVSLTLPKLKGDSIEDHFLQIAKEQAKPYQQLVQSIIGAELPEMPKVVKMIMKDIHIELFYILAMVFNCRLDLL